MNTIPQVSAIFVALFAWSLIALHTSGAETAATGDEYLVYVGSPVHTGQDGKNIYVFRFNARSGQLTSLGLAAEADHPGFLAVHPNHRFLYATNEIGDMKAQKGGAISAFSIDQTTGKLTLLNQVPTHGAHPTYATVDKTGKYVVVANYFGGTIEVFPVKKDGRLDETSSVARDTGTGANPKRQDGPHPHAVILSPDNRFAIAADLGIDKLVVYRFDAMKGSLTPNDPPYAKVNPGAGPRHLAFAPNGKFVYVINELHSSISAFSYNPQNGVLHLI